MKKTMNKFLSLLLCLTLLATCALAATAEPVTGTISGTFPEAPMNRPAAEDPTAGQTATATPAQTETQAASAYGLLADWTKDQTFTLEDPAPWNLEELKKAADVTDPHSVAAYWILAVNRLVDNYDDGMAMMKYLFADLQPFQKGYVEGGMSGKAGWDGYFDSRLKNEEQKWLPRVYFDGTSKDNGFTPPRPLRVKLQYNEKDTDAINSKSVEQLGRLSVVYVVDSTVGVNRLSLTLCRFDGTNRWYVTNGAASSAMFYDMSGALNAAEMEKAKAGKLDTGSAAEHQAKYGTAQRLPFTDVQEGNFAYDAIRWAYQNEVTAGTSATTFGPEASCTRGQVATFLWRAAGKPEPTTANNPFADVKQSDYFYKPVLWAVEKGITGGTSATAFSPAQTCSTAHIITFLYRALGVGSNGWYEEAASWAKSKGILDGTGIAVDPGTQCPRAAVATFLYRVYN